jgi:ATP-dependent helicase/nuclease subunit B
LTASAVEALRDCPYRFFALRLLGLQENDELDAGLSQRDYGTWLHAVLHRFHRERKAPASRDAEVARLHAAASAESAEQGFDEAEFLPYAATFEHFAARYVDWMHRRDADGARYREGEVEIGVQPPSLGGIELRGRIDRIDEVSTGEGYALELIDYKTGDVGKLKRRMQQPTEDTQLAVYAALVSGRDGAPETALKASYLGLDVRAGIVRIEHAEVEASAELLLDGLGRDVARLRSGAALPALGEGEVCEYCVARGLCRRDDWSPSTR